MLTPAAENAEAIRDTDKLETETASEPNFPAQSPTTAEDAGLNDEEWYRENVTLDTDLDYDDSPPPREITMTDLEALSPPASHLHSSELSDLNSPGDLDIEDLDESDLDDTDLPEDARLDSLEP